jgi:hypothetical protein
MSKKNVAVEIMAHDVMLAQLYATTHKIAKSVMHGYFYVA